MPLMKWNDSYSVGHSRIDSQHQKLVDILNQFFDALKGGEAASVQKQVLDQLVSYTREHFAFEEGEMQRVGYPDLAAHRREHESLVAKVGEFVVAFNSGNNHRNPQMLQFLKSWLVGHIQKSDKAYTPYFSKTRV